jgi:hypothetical protein
VLTGLEALEHAKNQVYKCKSFAFNLSIVRLDDRALPETFTESDVKRANAEYCQMCLLDFDKFKNRQHHCRRCGKSVCQHCSEHKRQMSKKDAKTLYRVCDLCDTYLENATLKHKAELIVDRAQTCTKDLME